MFKVLLRNKQSALVVAGSFAFLLGAIQPDMSMAEQASATNVSLSPGDKCRVTEGPNKGKTGTYGEDGWCEGDWGGTECGADNSKCEDVAGIRPGQGSYAITTAPLSNVLAATPPREAEAAPEIRIVGAVRKSRTARGAVDVTDRKCSQWITLEDAQIKSTTFLEMPPVTCDGQSYPVVSIRATQMPHRDSGSRGGPSTASAFKLSGTMTLPHFSGLGLVSDQEWDRCVDIYLDCQISCQAGDGGVWGSTDGCLSHCDAVFDACTFDPF